MTIQEHDPDAKPLDGDNLYEVSIGFSDIGGADEYEAAEVIWRILSQDYAKGLSPLFIRVGNKLIEVNTVTGEAKR